MLWQKIEHLEHRFAQHPLSKIQRTDDKLLGEYVKQNKGAHHEHQQALAEKPATKRPRSYMEGPRGGKASCKKSKKMYMVAASPKKRGRRGGGARARARAPPPPPLFLGGCPLRVRDSFYISIYLYVLIYPSIYIYNTYICIHLSLSLSLSLFKQVKLLERA